MNSISGLKNSHLMTSDSSYFYPYYNVAEKINKFVSSRVLVSWNVAVGSWRTKNMHKLCCSVCGSGKSEPDGGAAFSGAVFVGFTLVRGGAGDGLPGTPQAL